MGNKFLMKYLPPIHADGSVRFGNVLLLGVMVFVFTVAGVVVLGLLFGPMPLEAVIPAAGVGAALFPALAVAQCRNLIQRRP